MFRMIGGDGREYGPVSAEQLREWIAEGRANGQTLVQAEGGSDWRPLSSVPEFAGLWPGETTPVADVTGAGVEPAAGGLTGDGLPEKGPLGTRESVLDVGDCLGRGWMLLGGHFFLLAGATTLVWLILTLATLGTCVGGVVALVLAGPLYAGLLMVFLRTLRGEPTSIGDVFGFFGPAFLSLMLISVFTRVLGELGMMLCLVPGVFLKVIWAFALPLAADRNLEFWAALEMSRKRVLRSFFRVMALLAMAFLPLIVFQVYASTRAAGFLLEALGPVSQWQLESFRSVLGDFGQFAARLGLQEQVVLLLNLPFAFAALICAYEDLFGKRGGEAD